MSVDGDKDRVFNCKNSGCDNGGNCLWLIREDVSDFVCECLPTFSGASCNLS